MKIGKPKASKVGITGRLMPPPEENESALLALDETQSKIVFGAIEYGTDARLISRATGLDINVVRKALLDETVVGAINRARSTVGLNKAIVDDTLKEILLNKKERGSTRVNAASVALKALGEEITEITKTVEISQKTQDLTNAELLAEIKKVNPDAPIDLTALDREQNRADYFNATARMETKLVKKSHGHTTPEQE